MMLGPKGNCSRVVPGRSSARGFTLVRRGPRRGATAVEFALIAWLAFFPILFGIIELGRGLMVTELLNDAARIGCRAGVVEGKTTSDIQTAVNNFLPTVGINTDTVTVQVNDGSADASTALAGDELTVIVTTPVSKVTWLPGGKFLSGNLTGQFTLRRE